MMVWKDCVEGLLWNDDVEGWSLGVVWKRWFGKIELRDCDEMMVELWFWMMVLRCCYEIMVWDDWVKGLWWNDGLKG